mmetsp:Transcript_172/g.394  ORF Transcript_172/g.394 Transcript_172/m.394 type:complete len:213 (+) Transcript_172:878-1516(+)
MGLKIGCADSRLVLVTPPQYWVPSPRGQCAVREAKGPFRERVWRGPIDPRRSQREIPWAGVANVYGFPLLLFLLFLLVDYRFRIVVGPRSPPFSRVARLWPDHRRLFHAGHRSASTCDQSERWKHKSFHPRKEYWIVYFGEIVFGEWRKPHPRIPRRPTIGPACNSVPGTKYTFHSYRQFVCRPRTHTSAFCAGVESGAKSKEPQRRVPQRG